MSRDKILKIAIVVCAMIVALAVLGTFTGVFGQAFGYANAEKYTAGETEISGMVRNLDINWTSGKITVTYHGKDTVELKETANKSLNEDQKLRWWLDGDTLRVQYVKAGLRLDFGLSKELTLMLPEGFRLGKAEFNLTSGDIVLPELRADELRVSQTSGSSVITAEATKADLGCTSGDQKITLKGTTDSVRISSTSGSIRLEAENAKQVNAGTTSGNVDVQVGENEETEIGCTSGTVYVALKKLGRLKVNTTSGNVTAALPETPGFTANVSTTSGSMDSTMPLTKNGNAYTCCDGSACVEIGTTSGDVRIEVVK